VVRQVHPKTEFLALLLPLAYRLKSGAREGAERAYSDTYDLLSAVHASPKDCGSPSSGSCWSATETACLASEFRSRSPR
jgi:hypothetical protein